MNIGLAIKTVRTRSGMSQEHLSKTSGLSQTSISQIENGIKQPTKKTIGKLCKVLKVPEALLYIIGLENTDVPSSRKKMYEQIFPEIKQLAQKLIDEV